MVRRSTNPALAGLQATFDPNGLGENAATVGRAQQEENAYYGNAVQDPGVAGAVAMGQRGGAMGEDPGMKAFLQSLHERNATIGPHSGFMTHPYETEQRSTYDPNYQTSAVDPMAALAALSKRRKV